MDNAIKIFEGFIYWSLILIPFSIAIAPAPTNIFIGLLFFSFFTKKILKKEKFFSKTALNFPFLALLIISIISIINSIDYTASIRGIFKLVQYGLIYSIFVKELRDQKHIRRITSALLAGASLASLDAICQLIFGKDFIRGHLPIINIGLKRATAAFPNANVLGVYLTPIAPLAFGLALYYFKGKKRLFMFVLSALIMMGIALTFSRPAGLAFYLSLLLLSTVKKDKIVISILVILLIVFPFILPKNVKDWAKSINYNPLIFMCNHDRISVYKNSLNMIRHHPIIGVGVNTFSKNYLKYKLPEPENARTGDYMYAHNNFLHLAGEIGLFGLLVFLWLLLRLFRKSIYIYKNINEPYIKIVSLSLIISLIAFLINGLTETSLYYSRVAMIFWYLVGFSLSLNKFCYADRP